MAANERLRAAMNQAGIGVERLAQAAEVDPKTVYRWLSRGRPPKRPETRRLVAGLLQQDDSWLWPTIGRAPAAAPVDAEIVAAYTYRSDLPTQRWWDLISRASDRIDLLGYTLYFLALQHPELVETLRSKCEDGCRIRAVIADPDSEHVRYRDAEEGTPLTLVVRINTTLSMLDGLFGCPGFELRFQDTPLYNSIFRFDDQMLVTPHLYATTGAKAPLLHLRKVRPGGLFGQFAGHFDSIWQHATPASVDQSRPQDRDSA
ncbi:helix-turn-helix domain-containing protein [Actinocatenispora rupis]|uniref:Transcriptional regulator n=1 Tax=Actinocatenispora rupis TaxID=519421 RepID=A0A8J3NFI8_9ACTN|nr:helix-turn-helix domain-containing protein [Actinocatenispora rupis]GID14930.1 transcriptional regulator [Actinocatenispora rupis]